MALCVQPIAYSYIRKRMQWHIKSSILEVFAFLFFENAGYIYILYFQRTEKKIYMIYRYIEMADLSPISRRNVPLVKNHRVEVYKACCF